MSVHISDHAIQRAVERCGCVDDAAARALLSGRAFEAAVLMHAPSVKLGNGCRAILKHRAQGSVVVTVLLPSHAFPAELVPPEMGGVPWGI